MIEKYCSDCYYNHSCVCDDTYDDCCSDKCSVDDIIEANRIAFRSEWFEYIDTFYD